ncbi:hypothetical protein [Actinomyces sp. W5033]|uniref:hypothetical protein n=1 Tax=Actinomyces sp. W5033 TaxID=3446479 RepID=UPI003EE01B5F
MSDSRSSLSGSLLRAGVGLVFIAIGLKWIVELLQSAWMWLVGGLVIVAAVTGIARWRRSQW